MWVEHWDFTEKLAEGPGAPGTDSQTKLNWLNWVWNQCGIDPSLGPNTQNDRSQSWISTVGIHPPVKVRDIICIKTEPTVRNEGVEAGTPKPGTMFHPSLTFGAQSPSSRIYYVLLM